MAWPEIVVPVESLICSHFARDFISVHHASPRQKSVVEIHSAASLPGSEWASCRHNVHASGQRKKPFHAPSKSSCGSRLARLTRRQSFDQRIFGRQSSNNPQTVLGAAEGQAMGWHSKDHHGLGLVAEGECPRPRACSGWRLMWEWSA